MKFSLTYDGQTRTVDFDQAEPETPHAQITRVGRWRYAISILCNPGAMIETHYGGGEDATWYRYGRRRAEAKARRELARYKARQERETWTIR